MSRGGASREWSAFDRHHARRKQGIPTVTVLVGDVGSGETLWKSWAGVQGGTAVTSDCAPIRLVEAWTNGTEFASRVAQRFIAAAAMAEGVSEAELHARLASHSPIQLKDVLVTLARHVGCAPEIAWAALFGANGELEHWMTADFPRTLRDLSLLTDFAPLLLATERSDDLEWTSSALEVAVGVARNAPAIDVAVIISSDSMAKWERFGSPHRRAILAESVVHMDRHGPSCDRSRPGFRWGDRATEHVANDSDHPAAAIQQPPPPDTSAARSREESLLFDLLQSGRRTCNRFVLNAKVTAAFGDAPLEVDLLCEQLKLAIEVDGYHHFTDPVAYRRDRRKDVLLQELGYMVIRVLATDVTDEHDYVLGVIERALSQRERGTQ